MQIRLRGNSLTLVRHGYRRKGDATPRSKNLGTIPLDANPADLSTLRLLPGAQLSEKELHELRAYLVAHGRYGRVDPFPGLDAALERTYEWLEARWSDICASGTTGPMKAFAVHWKEVRDRVDCLQARLQELGAVCKRGNKAGE